MELLVAVGECYGAERMVQVTFSHLSCINPVTVGKGGKIFHESVAERSEKFVIPTTTNPTFLDPWAWQEMEFNDELYKDNSRLSSALAKMGGFLCTTCTPYLIDHTPRFGEHVAWYESSGILYANAALGSRTNREGGPSAPDIALIGRTPAYGYHSDENRYGKLEVQVNANLQGDTDYGTLGYFVGHISQDRVPVIKGIPTSVSRHELTYLGSAHAASESFAHYHGVSVTPISKQTRLSPWGKLLVIFQ